MDFKDPNVKEMFAKFFREQIQHQGLTVEGLAAKSGYDSKTIHNYLNPENMPKEVTGKFYTTMQTALQFQHQDFVQYYENHHVGQSSNANTITFGDLNISGGTTGDIVLGVKNIYSKNIDD